MKARVDSDAGGQSSHGEFFESEPVNLNAGVKIKELTKSFKSGKKVRTPAR